MISSWALATIGFVASLIYFLIYRTFLNKHVDSIEQFKINNCIASPSGINLAITNIIDFERDVTDYHNVGFRWWAWTAVFTFVIWMLVFKLKQAKKQ